MVSVRAIELVARFVAVKSRPLAANVTRSKVARDSTVPVIVVSAPIAASSSSNRLRLQSVDADIAGVEVISPANKQAYTVPNRCDFFDFATLEQQKAHTRT